jgi:hypothetical protein
MPAAKVRCLLGVRDIEAVGIGEDGGIAIGGVHHREDAIALLETLAGKIDIGGDEAGEGVARPVPAQHLLDGRLDEMGRIHQTPELGRMRQ